MAPLANKVPEIWLQIVPCKGFASTLVLGPVSGQPIFPTYLSVHHTQAACLAWINWPVRP